MYNRIYFVSHAAAVNAAENLNYDLGAGTYIVGYNEGKVKYFIQINPRKKGA